MPTEDRIHSAHEFLLVVRGPFSWNPSITLVFGFWRKKNIERKENNPSETRVLFWVCTKNADAQQLQWCVTIKTVQGPAVGVFVSNELGEDFLRSRPSHSFLCLLSTHDALLRNPEIFNGLGLAVLFQEEGARTICRVSELIASQQIETKQAETKVLETDDDQQRFRWDLPNHPADR